MRYHSSLIKHYITINDSVENIANKLILKTCEVEETIYRNLPEEVVIGKVVSVRKHPQADKLVVCSLDCGAKGIYQICTGGENVTEGSYVPVALPGCYLPVLGLKIEPRPMRGEESNGMICSKGELGINEDEEHHWIRTLQSDFDDITDSDCGVALRHKYPWIEAYIFDVDNKTVTHRPDLTGHFGLAWELHAMYKMESPTKIAWTKLPTLIDTHAHTNIHGIASEAKNHGIAVQVACDAVQVYNTILITNCTIQPSTFLMRTILRDCGSTPRNNWVDFGNMAMLLTGQPIHCFDADTIEGGIIVRYAKDGERFIDLMDGEHILSSTDIVIADSKKILALGGIIGGKSSAVSDTTKNILIEVAHFDPVVVRKTGTRLSLRTDAELRFEKYINPQYTSHAIQMILDLLQYWKKDLRDHTIAGISYDTAPTYSVSPKMIQVDRNMISTMIFGDDSLSPATASSILQGLGYTVYENTVTVPWRRSPDDMNGMHDIIEEVIRIYGYEHVVGKELYGKLHIPTSEPAVHIQQVTEQCLVDRYGYTQTETYPWVHEKYIELFQKNIHQFYQLQNAPAPELQYLRDMMLYGLLDVVLKNHKTTENIDIFDTGKTWPTVDGTIKEERNLGIVSYRNKITRWQDDPRLRVKNAVIAVLRTAGVKHPVTFISTSLPQYHSQKQCSIFIGDRVIGFLGQLNPEIIDTLKLPIESYVTYAELNMDIVATIEKTVGETDYQTLQDQVVSRDVCLVIDQSISYQILWDAIATIPDINDIAVFDLYAGETIPAGKKSCAFSFTITGNGNMTTEHINGVIQKVVKACEEKGAVLR